MEPIDRHIPYVETQLLTNIYIYTYFFFSEKKKKKKKTKKKKHGKKQTRNRISEQLRRGESPRVMWTKAHDRRFEGLDDREEESAAPFFTAVVLADAQFGFGQRDDDSPGDIANAERAVAVINRVRPRFAVVCGDLINMMPEIYPTLPEEIRATRAMQVRDFKRVFEKVDPEVPLV